MYGMHVYILDCLPSIWIVDLQPMCLITYVYIIMKVGLDFHRLESLKKAEKTGMSDLLNRLQTKAQEVSPYSTDSYIYQ